MNTARCGNPGAHPRADGHSRPIPTLAASGGRRPLAADPAEASRRDTVLAEAFGNLEPMIGDLVAMALLVDSAVTDIFADSACRRNQGTDHVLLTLHRDQENMLLFAAGRLVSDLKAAQEAYYAICEAPVAA